jgi:hypothetical protein
MCHVKSELPTALLRYLADADLHVISWDASAEVLLLKITKDIGPETGIIKFSGVSHVNLPPYVGISGIERRSRDELPTSFLNTYRPNDRSLDANEVAYLIHGSWGEEFAVIAQGIEYEIA